MATPVPVVSMMYFFVSAPPKTFVAVSPALSATSMKFARGGVSATFRGASCEKRGLPSSKPAATAQRKMFGGRARQILGLTGFKGLPHTSKTVVQLSWHLFFRARGRKLPFGNKKISNQIVRGLRRWLGGSIRVFRRTLRVT